MFAEIARASNSDALPAEDPKMMVSADASTALILLVSNDVTRRRPPVQPSMDETVRKARVYSDRLTDLPFAIYTLERDLRREASLAFAACAGDLGVAVQRP